MVTSCIYSCNWHCCLSQSHKLHLYHAEQQGRAATGVGVLWEQCSFSTCIFYDRLFHGKFTLASVKIVSNLELTVMKHLINTTLSDKDNGRSRIVVCSSWGKPSTVESSSSWVEHHNALALKIPLIKMLIKYIFVGGGFLRNKRKENSPLLHHNWLNSHHWL